ncbi:PREDICTED: uncharacterized protein LOC104811009 [Tarenaya hassleriana]|uniref:uncharacterized protein LOC104811009 n=1 Tax=Tarenaya hassleriana TaxID=28532 RepID=UPI00053CA940|nr:PREDICTED: uncharacterized protein LOC104811009 [Tarenaya hassleriana]
MAASTTVLRKSCSFPNILVTCLNLTLLFLSLFSVPPIVLLRNPPRPLGLAILAIALISFLSSLAGLIPCISHSFFVYRLTLLSSLLVGQFLTVVALFTRERQCLSALKSIRDPREAKALVRFECVVFMAMVLVQIMVLVTSWVLHCIWVREFKGFEAEKSASMARKYSGRVATVEEGFVPEGMDLEDKKTGKHVKWVKTDFEG